MISTHVLELLSVPGRLSSQEYMNYLLAQPAPRRKLHRPHPFTSSINKLPTKLVETPSPQASQLVIQPLDPIQPTISLHCHISCDTQGRKQGIRSTRQMAIRHTSGTGYTNLTQSHQHATDAVTPTPIYKCHILSCRVALYHLSSRLSLDLRSHLSVCPSLNQSASHSGPPFESASPRERCWLSVTIQWFRFRCEPVSIFTWHIHH